MGAALKPVQRTLNWLGHSPHMGTLREVAMRGIRVTYPTPRFVLPHRLDFPLLLDSRGLIGCGAEVGVKQGQYSETLLESWQGRHLISIDPWVSAPEPDYIDEANVTQETHNGYYEETCRRLARFGEPHQRLANDRERSRQPHPSPLPRLRVPGRAPRLHVS